MSLQQVITFAASSTTAIGALQAPVADTALAIKNSTPLGTPSYVIPNFARLVTLTSAANLSAIDFVISGLDINMNPITETLTGPNANTVSSTLNYHVILSIIPDTTSASTVSVGTGATGFSQWVTLDVNRTNSTVPMASVVVTGTIKYSINGTINRIQYPVNNGVTSGIVTPTLAATLDASFTGETTSIIGQFEFPYSGVQLLIESSTGGSAAMTVLQQGL